MAPSRARTHPETSEFARDCRYIGRSQGTSGHIGAHRVFGALGAFRALGAHRALGALGMLRA
eukprot:9059286-Alexandrium_andersonii.AAC.1